MEPLPETSTAAPKSMRTWLFNPFHYVAGWMALLVGLALILAASYIGSLSNSHFDGVLDFHTGAAAPLWAFMLEGPLDWIVLACLLFISGKIISASRLRALDVFGTQALARIPCLITALFALLPGYQRYGAYLYAQVVQEATDVQTAPADVLVFGLVMLVVILMTVWMVALMWRAYAVSCNVRGGKAIAVFIVALLVGEVVSKLAMIGLLMAAGVPLTPQ